MRLGNKTLGFVINFLLGTAWAVMLIGALISFLSFYHENLIFAFLSAFIGAVPGLVAVLLLEHIITGKETLIEIKKQTLFLEKIAEKSHEYRYDNNEKNGYTRK